MCWKYSNARVSIWNIIDDNDRSVNRSVSSPSIYRRSYLNTNLEHSSCKNLLNELTQMLFKIRWLNKCRAKAGSVSNQTTTTTKWFFICRRNFFSAFEIILYFAKFIFSHIANGPVNFDIRVYCVHTFNHFYPARRFPVHNYSADYWHKIINIHFFHWRNEYT